jgi:hypothetical protein
VCRTSSGWRASGGCKLKRTSLDRASTAAVASATRGDSQRPLRLRAAYTIDGDSRGFTLAASAFPPCRQWKWLKVVV